MPATSDKLTFVELADHEIDVVILALRHIEDHTDTPAAGALADRLQFGDQYLNAGDEYTRTTLRKRRLDAYKKKLNERLAELEQQVLDELAERGERGFKHDGTGKTVSITQQVWARIAKTGDDTTPEDRERAADALVAAGLGDYVQRGFNVQSLSAYFREQVNAWLDEQAQLPAHERQPLNIDRFLPEPLKGAIDLTNNPTLSVRG